MATFEVQVEGLTGLSIDGSSSPTQDELTQFLKDGVMDVTNRVTMLRPQDIDNFSRQSAEQTSNGFNPGSSKIVSVVREDGTNNRWYPCKKSSMSLEYKVTDPDSLHYASKYNPVYMISQNRNVHVYPEPTDGGNDTFKVLYVNYSPEEEDGTVLVYSSSGIKWFPDDKVYLVVLYAAIQSLMARMTSLNSSLPSDITLPSIPVAPSMNATTLSIPSFTAPDAFVQPVAPSGADIDFSDVPTAPTYTPPVLTLGSAPTISDLTISAVPPVAPSLSTITFSSVDSAVDANMNAVVAGNTYGGNTAPEYTKPTFTAPTVGGSADELTDITSLDAENTIDDYDGNSIEVDQWFATAAHLIEDEEDTELAAAQLQKIQTYITAYQAELGRRVQTYQADIQSELNEFNKENVVFQANIQEAMAEFQTQNQINISNAERSQNRQLQNSINDMKVLFDSNAQSIQKYQAELQSYQQKVDAEVQAYQQNLAGDIQVWQAERTTDLQKYGSDIQNETARIGNDMGKFQQEIAKAIQKYQAETGYDLGKYTAEVQTSTAKFTNDLQKNNTTFQSDLAKFSTDLKETQQENQEKLAIYNADVQKYNAELAGKAQEFTTSLQKDQADYQWAAQQYASLKAQYDGAFAVMAPPAPPQQQQRAARR